MFAKGGPKVKNRFHDNRCISFIQFTFSSIIVNIDMQQNEKAHANLEKNENKQINK